MIGSYLRNIKLFGPRLKTSKNIELNALPVYDERYIKNKIRAYGNNVYTNFRKLNVPEDDMECEFLQFFLVVLILCA